MGLLETFQKNLTEDDRSDNVRLTHHTWNALQSVVLEDVHYEAFVFLGGVSVFTLGQCPRSTPSSICIHFQNTNTVSNRDPTGMHYVGNLYGQVLT